MRAQPAQYSHVLMEKKWMVIYHSNHFCKITAVKRLLYHQIAFFLLDATLSFIPTTCTTSSASIIAQSLIPANTENIHTIDT
jgi:hypothetical protein